MALIWELEKLEKK